MQLESTTYHARVVAVAEAPDVVFKDTRRLVDFQHERRHLIGTGIGEFYSGSIRIIVNNCSIRAQILTCQARGVVNIIVTAVKIEVERREINLVFVLRDGDDVGHDVIGFAVLTRHLQIGCTRRVAFIGIDDVLQIPFVGLAGRHRQPVVGGRSAVSVAELHRRVTGSDLDVGAINDIDETRSRVAAEVIMVGSDSDGCGAVPVFDVVLRLELLGSTSINGQVAEHGHLVAFQKLVKRGEIGTRNIFATVHLQLIVGLAVVGDEIGGVVVLCKFDLVDLRDHTLHISTLDVAV